VPKSTSRSSSNGKDRGRNARGSGTSAVVTQVTQLVAANQTLQRENRELAEANARLEAELREIGSALGRLAGPTRGRGRGADALALPEVKPKRQRRPITDPDQLARRRQALEKARAARSEKLADARAAAATAGSV
jgi:hypothetical protein